MGKQAKCGYCGEIIDGKTPTKKYNSKTYHIHCYTKLCQEKYKAEIEKTKEGSQEKLYEYICQLFNIKELNSFLDFQLKKIFKENNFTYNGVLYTLKYFYEIKDNKPDLTYGIGIVPLMYDEAKNFYHKKSILRKTNDIDIKGLSDKKVRIDPKNTRHIKKKPYITIENL